ncbi:MAG: TRAP-type transport system periplasmic protein [Clostridiales bacterium]|nr:TRAP-type transport system periplasmic protein [Clostridiales bacterium]
MKKALKSVLALSLAIMLVFAVVGCSSSSTEDQPATADQPAKDGDKAADGQKYTIRIAHNQQSDMGYGIGVAKLKEVLEEKVGDKVELQIFDNGVLGNERDVTEGLTLGTVDMAITSVGVSSNFEPTLAAINLPFLVKNNDHLKKIMDQDLMKPAYDNLLKNKNIRALGLYAQGFRMVASNKGAINTLDDFKGLKIRVPEAPLFLSAFKALGANPTPIPWGEIYTSMQTHVVDAFENSPTVVYQYKLQEVIKYLSATNHIWEGGVIMISEDFYKKLPEDIQKALQEAVKVSVEHQHKAIEQQTGEFLEKIKEAGVKYNEVDTAAMQHAVQSVYDEFIKQNPGAKDMIDKMIEAGK